MKTWQALAASRDQMQTENTVRLCSGGGPGQQQHQGCSVLAMSLCEGGAGGRGTGGAPELLRGEPSPRKPPWCRSPACSPPWTGSPTPAAARASEVLGVEPDLADVVGDPAPGAPQAGAGVLAPAQA